MQVQNAHPIHAFVADADNIGLTGQREDTIDLIRLTAWLREDPCFVASESVVCSNWLSGMECLLLRAIGVADRLVEAHRNCDDVVEEQIVDLVERKGIRRLYLASGDGGYCDLIMRLQAEYGLRVHLIARRDGYSNALAKLCHGFTYMDDFVCRAAA